MRRNNQAERCKRLNIRTLFYMFIFKEFTISSRKYDAYQNIYFCNRSQVMKITFFFYSLCYIGKNPF